MYARHEGLSRRDDFGDAGSQDVHGAQSSTMGRIMSHMDLTNGIAGRIKAATWNRIANKHGCHPKVEF